MKPNNSHPNPNQTTSTNITYENLIPHEHRRRRLFSGVLILGALVTGAFASMAYVNTKDHKVSAIPIVTDVVDDNASEILEESIPEKPEETNCRPIDDFSMEQKIGSLLLIMAHSDELDSLSDTMTRDTISNFTLLSGRIPLNDFVQYDGNLVPFWQAATQLKQQVADSNGIVTTFASDEEGGDVQRSATLQGFADLPSAKNQSTLSSNDLRSMWQQHGEQLRAIGVDVVLGPVGDVGQWGNIGNRSYGNSAEEVIRSLQPVVEGLRSTGLKVTGKHAPGLGTVQDNTHFESGTTRNINDVEMQNETSVFRWLTQAGAENLMVSHASTPGLTESTEPASLSSNVYQYIRNVIGFNGVIMTDALDMVPVAQHQGLPNGIQSQASGAVLALQAGADMAIIELQAANATYQAILEHVPKDIIDQSAKKVLSINKGYAICDA